MLRLINIIIREILDSERAILTHKKVNKFTVNRIIGRSLPDNFIILLID